MWFLPVAAIGLYFYIVTLHKYSWKHWENTESQKNSFISDKQTIFSFFIFFFLKIMGQKTVMLPIYLYLFATIRPSISITLIRSYSLWKEVQYANFSCHIPEAIESRQGGYAFDKDQKGGIGQIIGERGLFIYFPALFIRIPEPPRIRSARKK